MRNEQTHDWDGLSKELHAVLAFVRAGPRTREQAEAALRDIDWNQFERLVMHHRVYPSIYSDPGIGELIPADVRQALKAAYGQNVFRMLRLSGETQRVCRALAARGVRSIVLKGPALAKELYGDISLRTSKDLDILIPMDGIEQAEAALAELGFTGDKNVPRIFRDWKWKVHHLSFTHPQTGIQVEIHWRLNSGMGKEPSFEELWACKRTSSMTRYPVYMLGSEHLFLYLVSHGARHGWFRLRWLADIDRLVGRKLNGRELIPLLRRYGCLHLAGQALILASRLLHTPIPEGLKPLLAGSRPRRLARRSLYFIRNVVAFSPVPSSPELARYYKRYLFSLKTGGEKIVFLIRQLYPSFRDAEALPLPKELHFLYFPLRPFVWLWRQIKA